MKMRQIEEDELLGHIQAQKEDQNTEFKSAFDWHDVKSRKLKEEIIKAVIAMSNTPTGGRIILGIREDNKSKKKLMDGVRLDQISWIEKNFEKVESDIHKFCSDYPAFEFLQGNSGKLVKGKLTYFIIISVTEFRARPIICKLTGDEQDEKNKKILSDGDMYVRTYDGQWASKKCSSKELEDVIKMATDKSQKDLEIRGYVRIDQVKDLMERLKKERTDYE
jgi:hypothetical protein